jgi:hypothetical protein
MMILTAAYASAPEQAARHVADTRVQIMGMSQRDNHLESAGRIFGVEGKLALAEYYASLANPVDFHWGVAVEHIGYRLQLSDPGLRRLAVAVLQNSSAGRRER